MTAVSRRGLLGAACLLLAGPASSGAAPLTAIAPAAVAATTAETTELVAMGDPPTVPRRRGRQSKEKDKPYQPLAKDPAGESEAAHKEYLKRYGF